MKFWNLNFWILINESTILKFNYGTLIHSFILTTTLIFKYKLQWACVQVNIKLITFEICLIHKAPIHSLKFAAFTPKKWHISREDRAVSRVITEPFSEYFRVRYGFHSNCILFSEFFFHRKLLSGSRCRNILVLLAISDLGFEPEIRNESLLRYS